MFDIADMSHFVISLDVAGLFRLAKGRTVQKAMQLWPRGESAEPEVVPVRVKFNKAVDGKELQYPGTRPHTPFRSKRVHCRKQVRDRGRLRYGGR